MSSREQAVAAMVSSLAFSFDGAILGVALAYAAVRSLLKFASASKSLRRIRNAPSLTVSDLRSLLDGDQSQPPTDRNSQGQNGNNNNGDHNSDGSGNGDGVVIVRGHVEAKPAVDGSWKSLRPSNVLVSRETGDKAVILQRTRTCIYNEWKGFFGWASDLRAIFRRSSKKHESTSFRMVPFILVDDRQPQSLYVIMNMDGSKHPLPLTTVYHQLQPVNASPYTFLQALFGHEYPVGFLDEVKILPLRKEISAIGFCSLKNGDPQIKSCKDLPYFLSDMTKDQMVADLVFNTKVLLWSGIILGSLSIGVLSYAVMRNWNKWKAWRQLRQSQQTSSTARDDNVSLDEDEEVGDVPDGQLCVICLMRRRRCAFIPCGHLVCCQVCAISIERQLSPKCPLCRQEIRTSMRIFQC